MIFPLTVWLALLVLLLAVVVGRGGRSGPLVIAYFCGISLIYVPGAVAYLGAGTGIWGAQTAATGFKAMILGLSFFIGGVVLAQALTRRRARPVHAMVDDWSFSVRLIVIGVAAFFLVLPVSAIIPSATALVSGVGSLIIIGFWYYFHRAARERDRRAFLIGVAALPLLPILTMITGGFIGFGLAWMLAVGAMIYVEARRKLIYVAALPFAAIIGLSFAVGYFNERGALRDAVWYEQADLQTRLSSVGRMVTEFELLDLQDPAHVRPILNRLNESALIGLGIERHEAGIVDLKYGGTVPVWAVIPRALWPDKPEIGGGRDLVSGFTGLWFPAGTSVGVGQPLEFYMNFGWAGLIGGFLLFGFILARLDLAIRRALIEADIRSLLRAGLPGVALLNPNGNLLESLVAVVSGLIVAVALEFGLRQVRIVDRTGHLLPPTGRRAQPARPLHARH